MKKRIIAGMMLLVLTISGCSAVSKAPTRLGGNPLCRLWE